MFNALATPTEFGIFIVFVITYIFCEIYRLNYIYDGTIRG
jgi:hypothetical protein